jgi:hypothetical protein
MAGTPPRASLNGIPPELRNNIYNRIAVDIDEVSVIGRKLTRFRPSCTPTEAANRMWNAIAKHPLSQTCRVLRKEFNPIHRYHVMRKGVPRYILELKNYDVDRMARLGDLITLAGPLLEQLRTQLTAEKFVIRFLLNGHVVKSVRVLNKYAQTPGRLGSSYANLKGVLPHGSDYWSWEVTLNLYNKSLSTAERATATSHEQEAYVRQVLGHMNGVRVYGDNRVRFENAHRTHGPRFRIGVVHNWSSDSDKEVASLLWKYHKKANAGFQAAKREMHHIKVQNDVREKLREELRQSVRQELQQIVREEVRDEMKEEMLRIKRELKDELRSEMQSQMEALRV